MDQYFLEIDDPKDRLIANLRAESARLKDELEQARKTGSYWKSELSEANKEIDRLKAELEQAKADTLAWKQQVEAKAAALDAVHGEVLKLNQQLEQAKETS